MGDVVSFEAFRDRRKATPDRTPEVAAQFNKDTLHAHMRELHGWGGAKSQHTRADLDRIHDDIHVNPLDWAKPHRHV